MENKEEIIIYNPEIGKNRLEVRLQNETIWLNLNQIAALFERNKSVISRHIKNIYKERELTAKSTVAFFATVQKEGKRSIVRKIEFYNLDMIISVGYRVNSKRGTQFRIWATGILKGLLLKGKTEGLQLSEMKKLGEIAKKAIEEKDISINEARGIINVIANYANTFSILNQFDNKSLQKNSSKKKILSEIRYDEAIPAIDELKKKLIITKQAFIP